MSTLKDEITSLHTVESGVSNNKVANFSYTQQAYTDNDVNSVDTYDYEKEQNIPSASTSVLTTNQTVLDKGFRSQASSIPRMIVNHFFGRTSYNLNKVNDIVTSLLYNLKAYIGASNGLATLDENGRIPYSQLPESAMEFKGMWNASTNSPTLVNGTGTKGDFYIVSVAGTQFSTTFKVNDRVIYDGSSWQRLANGSVSKVNNVEPVNENVTITGTDINMSSSDTTTLNTAILARQKNVVVLTQSEYDALTTAQKKGNLYLITDATSFDQNLINDNVTSADSTWSSNKIKNQIESDTLSSLDTSSSKAVNSTAVNGALANYLKFDYYETIWLTYQNYFTIYISTFSNGTYLLTVTCDNAGFTSMYVITKKSYNTAIATIYENGCSAILDNNNVKIYNNTGYDFNFVFSITKIQY